jgi:hypothetical protein
MFDFLEGHNDQRMFEKTIPGCSPRCTHPMLASSACIALNPLVLIT